MGGARLSDALLAPLQYGFVRNGLVAATLAGALCGLVGTFVVLRGMSYVGHGLSHAIFGGFAASSLAGVNVLAGAGAWGVASALAINAVARRRVVGVDAAIGVVTTASFALGVVLFAASGRAGPNFEAALFGSILGVTGRDVAAVAAVLAVSTALLLAGYRPLLFTTFDPDVAEASGVRTRLVDGLLMGTLAVAILVAMRVMGVTLVAAALVTPPATARMITDSFNRMLLLACLLGAGSGAAGMLASYHLDVQSGPVIVLVSTGLFVVTYAATAPSRTLRRPPACADRSQRVARP